MAIRHANMTVSRECIACSALVPAEAKFCTSCGKKLETPRQESPLTTAAVTAYLRGECEELGDLSFRKEISLQDGRSQVVFVLVYVDDDGETEFDDITIWSIFAAVGSLSANEALQLDTSGLGIQQIGDYYAVQTSIRPLQLRDLNSLEWIMVRVAIAAELLEIELFGTDTF